MLLQEFIRKYRIEFEQNGVSRRGNQIWISEDWPTGNNKIDEYHHKVYESVECFVVVAHPDTQVVLSVEVRSGWRLDYVY